MASAGSVFGDLRVHRVTASDVEYEVAGVRQFGPAVKRADGKTAAGAQKLFDRELGRQPLQHEVRFWAAQAAWHLGDAAKAADHLRQAMDNSPDPRSQAVYATKLDHLLDRFRASRLQ